MVGHQEHPIYARSVTPRSCLLQHPEHLSQNDTSVPGVPVGKPRSFYGLNGQTVAVFPELAQLLSLGTLGSRSLKSCGNVAMNTVTLQYWHHQSLLDVKSYLLTVVRDVSSSTNKINRMCMSRRDLTKLL